MAVTFVGRAQRDLDEAWLYIAEESLSAADNYDHNDSQGGQGVGNPAIDGAPSTRVGERLA